MKQSDLNQYIKNYLDYMLDELNNNKISDKKYYINPIKKLYADIQNYTNEDFLFSFPLNINLELTSACNLRCKHCYYSSDKNNYNTQNDLSSEQLWKVIDEIIDIGAVRVVITGGEPFLNKEIIDIIKKLKNNNIAIYILTNAILIKDNDISNLSSILNPDLDRIQVSLDGATPETHNNIRNAESFEITVENIRKMVSSNITTIINYTINNKNVLEIPKMYELAQEIGVNAISFSKLVPTTKDLMKLTPDKYDLFFVANKLIERERQSESKTKLFMNFLDIKELAGFEPAEILLDEYLQKIPQKPLPKYVGCNLHDKLDIRANGNVSMCLDALCSDTIMGNIKEKSLREIWDNRFNNIMFQRRPCEKMKCIQCKYFSYCTGGCVGRAYREHNDLFAADSLCEYYNTHIKAQFLS